MGLIKMISQNNSAKAMIHFSGILGVGVDLCRNYSLEDYKGYDHLELHPDTTGFKIDEIIDETTDVVVKHGYAEVLLFCESLTVPIVLDIKERLLSLGVRAKLIAVNPFVGSNSLKWRILDTWFMRAFLELINLLSYLLWFLRKVDENKLPIKYTGFRRNGYSFVTLIDQARFILSPYEMKRLFVYADLVVLAENDGLMSIQKIESVHTSEYGCEVVIMPGRHGEDWPNIDKIGATRSKYLKTVRGWIDKNCP